MKALIVYYSRSGNTRKIAGEIAELLEGDLEEIIDTQKRSGILGWLRSGSDAMRKSQTVLKDPMNDPVEYDLVVIGSPNWASHLSSAIRTYIHQNQDKLKDVAFFGTAGGDNFTGVFDDMTEILGKSPVATCGIRAKEIKDGSYESKLQEFIKELPR